MYFALPMPMIILPISPVTVMPSYNFGNPHCMGSNSRCTHCGCQQSKEDDVSSDDTDEEDDVSSDDMDEEDDVSSDDMDEEDDLSSEDMDEEVDEDDVQQEMIDEIDIKIVEIHEGVNFNEFTSSSTYHFSKMQTT